MEENNWINILTAVGSIATPVLVVVLSAIGWKAKSNIERKIEIENSLRNDRIEIYNKILEPFIIILMSDNAWASDKKNKGKDKAAVAIAHMLSLEYRRLGFKFTLMANDEVVKSYNNLMQYFYNLEEEGTAEGVEFLKKMMELLGTFLLEIRKGMGNETTNLDYWDMCEWWLSDARKIKNGTYKNA